MLFAGKRRILELENDFKTLKTAQKELQKDVEAIRKGWESELLNLSNAKDLIARASARLERAASRAAPPEPPVEEPPNGDGHKKPTELTNPFAARMLGLKG